MEGFPYKNDLTQQPQWAQDAIARFAQVANEANGSSDRACAIVLTAALEEMLRKLLSNYLPETQVKLRTLIPLGRMAQLIDLAEGMGVVVQRIAASLRSINVIRNQFAHRVLEDPTFNSPQLSNAMSKLIPPFILKNDQRNSSNRENFVEACGMTFLALTLQAGFIVRSTVIHPQMNDLTLDMEKVPTEAEIRRQFEEST